MITTRLVVADERTDRERGPRPERRDRHDRRDRLGGVVEVLDADASALAVHGQHAALEVERDVDTGRLAREAHADRDGIFRSSFRLAGRVGGRNILSSQT